MTHEDRQQCLQLFRGGRFAIVIGQQDIKPLARICLLNLQSNLLLKITIRDGVERIFAILRAALTRHLKVRAPRVARITIVT